MGIREAWAGLFNKTPKASNPGLNWKGGTKTGHIFDGSKYSGLSRYPSGWSLDNESLRESSRAAYWDSTQARSIITRLVDNTVGTGLALESRPIWGLLKGLITLSEEEKHDKARDIEQRFDLWASSHEADAASKKTLYEIQAFEFMHRLIDGESFLILKYSGDASRMSPLSIQFLLPEQISTPSDRITLDATKSAGRRIVDGIEIDAYGKEYAIYVKTENLQEWTRIPTTGPSGRTFVLHPTNSDTMGSVRGTPRLAPLVHELKKITDYTVAEIEAAVINAVIAVWVKPSPDAPSTRALAGIGKNKASTENSTNATSSSQKTFDKPGLIVQTLGAGEEVQSFDTKRPNANFGAFVRQIELGLGASQGIPLSVMNMEATKSYSAIRAELLMFWNTIEIERTKSASQFLNPIFEAWFTEEVRSKRIEAQGFEGGTPISRRAWLNCSWNGDKQPSIDPLKEAMADRARIEDGLTTRERAAMEWNGSDAMENIKRLKIENKELAEANEPMKLEYMAQSPLTENSTPQDETE